MSKKPIDWEAIIEGKVSRPYKKIDTPSIEIKSLIPIEQEVERQIGIFATEKFKSVTGCKFVVHAQTRGRRKHCAGWFSGEVWKDKDGVLYGELNICAEVLMNDPMEISGYILHELVHATNHTLGIKDCAKNDRHNLKFKESAENVGLIVVDNGDSKGHAYTSVGQELEKFIKTIIKPNTAVFDMYRLEAKPKPKAPTKTKAYICGCDVTVRVANGTKLDATCHDCNAKFILV